MYNYTLKICKTTLFAFSETMILFISKRNFTILQTNWIERKIPDQL